jgi:hypothetical protein
MNICLSHDSLVFYRYDTIPIVWDESGNYFEHKWNTQSSLYSDWLDDRGLGAQVQVGLRIFISPCRPDRFWGPSNGYRGSFPGGKASGA